MIAVDKVALRGHVFVVRRITNENAEVKKENFTQEWQHAMLEKRKSNLVLKYFPLCEIL